MKFKKLLWISIALIVIVAIALFLVIKLFDAKKTKLEDIQGQTMTLSEAKSYVAELAQSKAEDDFTDALLEKTTITVVSIDQENELATVEVRVPDVQRIMKSSLPDNTDGDFDSILDAYLDNINRQIALAKEETYLVKSAECPIVSFENGETVSIAGMEIVSFDSIIAELVEYLLVEEEAQ